MSNFRITTNGVMRTYRSNLYKSQRKLYDSMVRVETHRQFNSYAEDPARAARAFQTRRSLWRTGDQLENNDSVFNKFSTAFTAVDAIVDGDVDNPGFDGIKESLGIITDTAGAGRKPQGQVLLSMADSVLKTMNTTYGDNFVFAGADGLNVPYSFGENGEVLYRGINVDNRLLVADAKGVLSVREPKTQGDFQKDDGTGTMVDDQDAYIAYLEDITRTEKSLEDDFGGDKDAYIGYMKDQANVVKKEAQQLLDMSQEATYVDIGLGMEENRDGEVVASSAFNSALSGLDFLGFGVDEDGDARNFISLIRELGEIAHNADPDTGAYSDDSVEDTAAADRANVLAKKIRSALGRASEAHVELDAECTYLKSNQKQLESTEDTLQAQREGLEAIDPADAITDMLWAQYCYNAALRIGNDVLSQSLLDYMR